MHAPINYPFLLGLRDYVGLVHGSNELCMLLYSLVKRQRPLVVLELGTGMGVSSAWIAAALIENQHGQLFTFDNGSHYASPEVRRYLQEASGPIAELANAAQSPSYLGFLQAVLQGAGVADAVYFGSGDITLGDADVMQDLVDARRIDMVFSDFQHGPQAVIDIIKGCLPIMSEYSSILIDSASTHIPSYLLLERILDELAHGHIPGELSDGLSEQRRDHLRAFVRSSRFQLVHLTEGNDRDQNSTAWLRIEPRRLCPGGTSHFH